jgi:hypothetical protein
MFTRTVRCRIPSTGPGIAVATLMISWSHHPIEGRFAIVTGATVRLDDHRIDGYQSS